MNEYKIIFLVTLFVIAIISMILFMYIGDVERQVDELEKLVLDLEKLNVEQNEKNLKHKIDVVDEVIKNLEQAVLDLPNFDKD